MNTVTDILIRPDHPCFAGHFPGMPIVPGVVLLDEALYAIAARAGVSIDRCTLDTVKFKAAVRPGQAVTLHYEFTGSERVRFELRCAKRVAAMGTISFSVADRAAGGG